MWNLLGKGISSKASLASFEYAILKSDFFEVVWVASQIYTSEVNRDMRPTQLYLLFFHFKS